MITWSRKVPGSRSSTRRCGVEFEELSVKHKVMLEDFIDCFSVKSNGQEYSKA